MWSRRKNSEVGLVVLLVSLLFVMSLAEDPDFCQSDSEYLCRDGKKCIVKEYLCNNFNDCPDKDDETNCGKWNKSLETLISKIISC